MADDKGKGKGKGGGKVTINHMLIFWVIIFGVIFYLMYSFLGTPLNLLGWLLGVSSTSMLIIILLAAVFIVMMIRMTVGR